MTLGQGRSKMCVLKQQRIEFMIRLPFPFKFKIVGGEYTYVCLAPNSDRVCRVHWLSDRNVVERTDIYTEVDVIDYIDSGVWKIVEFLQPEYTPEQLSEIELLHDRVDMLDSLCSDYVEQIEGLDYVLEQHKKALNKFTKLTVLLSENHKVADLVDAQIGDDVVDKIYDYLLSQVE